MAERRKTKPVDAIAILKADHQKVPQLFQQYEGAQHQQTKQQIAERVFVMLETHTQFEEVVFYPAFAQLADAEGKQLVAESLREHQAVKDLIQALRALDAVEEEAEFGAKFQELRDSVDEHVEDEETQLFPQAEEVLEEQLEDLHEEMQEVKEPLTPS
jgi:hemerythrin-like domain-containing protein